MSLNIRDKGIKSMPYCSECKSDFSNELKNCSICKEKKIEGLRRMLLKISTAIMISIIGPASAWSVGQEQGLMIYLLVYISSKYLSSIIASRNTKVAIISYRYAPMLLVLSGLVSLAPSSIFAFAVILPTLLGAYEGAYWSVYFDYKPWIKNVNFDTKSNHRIVSEPIGIIEPSDESVKKAKFTSVPFAICQFVIQNSMRFVALQRGILWLAVLVVIAEIIGYAITLIYRKVTEDSSDLIKIQRTLWTWGQVVLLVGISLMILGHSFELFTVYLVGWLIAQGSARGCLRKIEIQWSQNFLKDVPGEKNKRDKDLDRFQRNEVIAAIVGVVIATWLKIQQDYDLDPALIGAGFAGFAWFLKFPKFKYQLAENSQIFEIGLRERFKFSSHLFTIIIFVLPAILLSTQTLILMLLIFGFMCAILAVVWAEVVWLVPDN